MLLETLESTISMANLTPSIMVLCSSEIALSTSGFTSSFVVSTGVVFLFFLKLLLSVSYTAEFSTFVETVLPFGKNLALLLCVEFYSEIFASFKLEILGTCLVYSMHPSAFILIWNSYIHPIL
jgi:hypothetical protein